MGLFSYVAELVRLAIRFAIGIGWQWWLVAFCAGVLASVVRKRYAGDRRSSWCAVAAAGLLAMYLTLVLAYTVLSRAPLPVAKPVNAKLLGTLVKRLSSVANSHEVVLNVVMFMPVGFLAPLAMNWSCRKTAVVSLIISLTIEVVQFVFLRGRCELSDLFTNALGALLGYGLCVLSQRFKERRAHLLGAF